MQLLSEMKSRTKNNKKKIRIPLPGQRPKIKDSAKTYSRAREKTALNKAGN